MIKFGTGGWRCIIGDDFIKDNICKVAQAVANIMLREGLAEKGTVIGFDRRFLSEDAAKWIGEVFAGNGIFVNFIDKIAPTPLVMYAVSNLECEYGMAVTASHNPAKYNGIKVFTAGGRDASEEITGKIEKEIESTGGYKCLDFEAGIKKGLIKIIDPQNDYIDTIMGYINVEKIKESKLKILLDPMYGVSKSSLLTILLSCRCNVELIHERHDPLFGGRMPTPTYEALYTLRQHVVEKGYDIGIATDGDADRLGVVDSKGNYIHPNEILALLYYYFLEYKGVRRDVVRNLATTHLLDKIAAEFGTACHEVPVGFKYVSSKIDEVDAIIGGESSGGLAINGHIKGKDGIFAACLLIEMVAVTGKSLNEIINMLYDRYGRTYMTESSLVFTNEQKTVIMDKLYKQRVNVLPALRKVEKTSYMDGLKLYFEDGWAIIRFSGTEPVLRIFVELPDRGLALKVSDEIGEIVKGLC